MNARPTGVVAAATAAPWGQANPAHMPRITLLTDFGTADGYVAAMKGVIASIAPDAVIDDVGHTVAPGDVFGASLALSRYWSLYPPGTIHLVVVDPGVGTTRRALAARADGRLCVAPDNGVLTHVFEEASDIDVVALEAPAYRRPEVSSTFHGRDIFAPAAAHLARGTQIHDLGSAVHDAIRLQVPKPVRTSTGVEGEVVHVDGFGNLITNVPGDWVPAGARISIGGRDVGPLQRTYGDVDVGEVVALVGSIGLLEISVRDGSAAKMLQAGRGALVEVF